MNDIGWGWVQWIFPNLKLSKTVFLVSPINKLVLVHVPGLEYHGQGSIISINGFQSDTYRFLADKSVDI